MSLISYEPSKFFEDLQKEVNSIFHKRANLAKQEEQTPLANFDWSPRVDIVENDASFLIKAEIPGVKPEEIELSIDSGILTIKGHKEFSQNSEKDGVKRSECHYGSFMRQFSLPRDVIGEEIEAHSDHGVLEITIPKKDVAPASGKIEIKKKS